MDKNINTTLPIGTILHGEYKIEQYLASGGFGNTYLVRNLSLDGLCVVKEFFIKNINDREKDQLTVSVSNHSNQITFEKQLQKFKKEAQRLYRIKHPNVVRVLALFEENGTAYYVMDYIAGESLSQRLKRMGTLPENEVLQYTRSLIETLHSLHNQAPTSIYHLDIKPANIMLSDEGEVILIDFGASKNVDPETGVTSNSELAYTRGFAPPEQMEGSIERFGPWTDFYALGATIYNLLSGKTPPVPSAINDDKTPLKENALPMKGIAKEPTRSLVVWLMQNNRNARPQDGQCILDRLNEIRGNQSTPIPTPVVDDFTIIDTARIDTARIDTSELIPPPIPKPKPSFFSSKISKILLGAIVSLFLVGISVVLIPPTSEKADEMAQDINSFDGEISFDGETVRYKGALNESRVPHGKGEIVTKDGRTFTGNFVNGAYSNGLFKYANGDSYTGTFYNNRFSKGTYTIKATGEYFVGTFSPNSGQPLKGKWYNAKGKCIQVL